MSEPITVALVTTWEAQCGVATYSANLVANCPNVIFRIVKDFQAPEAVYAPADIVHLNWQTTLFSNFPWQTLMALRGYGKKLVITYNDTGRDIQFWITGMFDKVVVHEPTNGFVHIPHGIPEVKLDPYRAIFNRLGIAGFPFNWKGFHPAAKVAAALKMDYMAIMPRSPHADTAPMEQAIRNEVPHANVITDWLPEESVIKLLASNVVNTFPYRGDNAGISGAVRMGLAAQRPIVLTRDRQFNDLFAYEDEIYFVHDSLEATVQQALDDYWRGRAKIPSRVLADMGWSKAGEKYKQVYESLRG